MGVGKGSFACGLAIVDLDIGRFSWCRYAGDGVDMQRVLCPRWGLVKTTIATLREMIF